VQHRENVIFDFVICGGNQQVTDEGFLTFDVGLFFDS
jgi:hypothetical protein